MRKLLFILMLGFCGMVSAQDYSFVNHNLTPFSLNPSLAGNAKDIRLGLNYRQQWMALGNRYHTIRSSFDMSFHQQACNVGFAYSFDNMAGGVFNQNEFDFVYAQRLLLKEGMTIRLGVMGSFFLNRLGWDKIKYGDQYDDNSKRPTLETMEDFENDTRSFFDVSVGASFNIENKLTLGAALYHIAEPNNGFNDLKENTLHRKLVFHINYLKDLQNKNGLWGRSALSDNYLFINGSYQKQDEFQMANLGVGVAWDPIIFGVSDKNTLTTKVNVVGFMAGVHFKGLQVFYVFDLFTSKKHNGSWSHELNLIYIISKKDKYPCPATYW